MNIDQFKKEKGEQSWFYSPDGDMEIFIKGDDSRPDIESFELAKKLMPILKECESKAIHLLESFMKDRVNGSFVLYRSLMLKCTKDAYLR